jgi:hypothetical protein
MIFVTSDFEFFFSASSYYPGRGQDLAPHFPTLIPSENEAPGNSDSGSTDIESEEEWLSVPSSLEPTARDSSKASHVLAIEVRTNFILPLSVLQLYL